jgi:hypothetical protein
MGSCAQNVITLIIGNAFVGLAVPAQIGFTIALAELVPKKARGYLNAGLFCASLPFATFGTVIARALATNTKAGWRWCYYLNVITTILAIALFFFFYHPPSLGQLHTKSSKIQVLKTLDYGGIFLFTVGLTIFLLSLSWVVSSTDGSVARSLVRSLAESRYLRPLELGVRAPSH